MTRELLGVTMDTNDIAKRYNLDCVILGSSCLLNHDTESLVLGLIFSIKDITERNEAIDRYIKDMAIYCDRVPKDKKGRIKPVKMTEAIKQQISEDRAYFDRINSLVRDGKIRNLNKPNSISETQKIILELKTGGTMP